MKFAFEFDAPQYHFFGRQPAQKSFQTKVDLSNPRDKWFVSFRSRSSFTNYFQNFAQIQPVPKLSLQKNLTDSKRSNIAKSLEENIKYPELDDTRQQSVQQMLLTASKDSQSTLQNSKQKFIKIENSPGPSKYFEATDQIEGISSRGHSRVNPQKQMEEENKPVQNDFKAHLAIESKANFAFQEKVQSSISPITISKASISQPAQKPKKLQTKKSVNIFTCNQLPSKKIEPLQILQSIKRLPDPITSYKILESGSGPNQTHNLSLNKKKPDQAKVKTLFTNNNKAHKQKNQFEVNKKQAEQTIKINPLLQVENIKKGVLFVIKQSKKAVSVITKKVDKLNQSLNLRQKNQNKKDQQLKRSSSEINLTGIPDKSKLIHPCLYPLKVQRQWEALSERKWNQLTKFQRAQAEDAMKKIFLKQHSKHQTGSHNTNFYQQKKEKLTQKQRGVMITRPKQKPNKELIKTVFSNMALKDSKSHSNRWKL